MKEKDSEAIAGASNGALMMNHKKQAKTWRYNSKLLKDGMPKYVCHGTHAENAYKICIEGRCEASAEGPAGGPGVYFIGVGNDLKEESILGAWVRSRENGYCHGGLIIAELDGIVIPCDGKTKDLPAGVIGTYDKWGKPRQYVAHVTTIEFVAVVFDVDRLDSLLGPAMNAAKGYTPAMHKSLQKCKEFLESPTAADGTMVRLINDLVNARPQRPPRPPGPPEPVEAQAQSQEPQQLPTGPMVIPVHYNSGWVYSLQTGQWYIPDVWRTWRQQFVPPERASGVLAGYSIAQQQPQQASAAASSSSGQVSWPVMFVEQDQIAQNDPLAGPGPDVPMQEPKEHVRPKKLPAKRGNMMQLPKPAPVPNMNLRRPAQVPQPVGPP